MTIEADLYARCKAVSAITDIFGTGDNCRIYPDEIPREVTTYPAARFELISDNEPSMMGSDCGVEFTRFQFSVFAETRLASKNAMRAIRAGLKRYRGTGTVTIQDILAENSIYLGQEPDSRLFMHAVDFTVIYAP